MPKLVKERSISLTDNTEDEVLQSLDEEDGKSEEEKSSKRRKLIFHLLRKKIFRQEEVPGSAPDGSPLDLSDPTHFGLITSRHQHLFIPSGDGQLGAWYLQPTNHTDDNKIILYNHGVSNTRGGLHRIGLYNVLLRNGFRILTYDYRRFGDSSKTELTEDSMVDDCRAALAWLRQKEGKEAKILVWGHSMGTGITCHSIAQTFIDNGDDTGVAGVVLEAPYNNFAEELKEIGKSVKNPFVNKALKTIYKATRNKPIEKLVVELNIAFASDSWIQNINCPVMILHAEDDPRIPITLGEKLFEAAKAAGKTDIQFHKFEAHFELAHSGIYKSDTLPALIEDFYNKLNI